MTPLSYMEISNLLTKIHSFIHSFIHSQKENKYFNQLLCDFILVIVLRVRFRVLELSWPALK